ncbi:MAG TPA: PaaI family thioesterase [Candidatus Binataceae bacterium]|nr:PaaI family thioesterase [Candidatus Binataceae bacterium]
MAPQTAPGARIALVDLNRLIRDNRIAEYPSPNLALGMRPLEFGPGTSRWTWTDQPSAALNPFGLLQGGYLAIFVDELCSTAIASVLEEREWSVTAECKISYLRALKPGVIAGTAEVIRRSRSLAFLAADLRGADGRIAVQASATWAISQPQSG